MDFQILFKMFCLRLVCGEVVAPLKCFVERHADGTTRYSLSPVPGKNCTDFWSGNGVHLTNDDNIFDTLVMERGANYLVAKKCLSGVKYIGHCDEDQYPEVECNGTCPTPATFKGAEGNANSVIPSTVIIAFCLVLIAFTI